MEDFKILRGNANFKKYPILRILGLFEKLFFRENPRDTLQYIPILSLPGSLLIRLLLLLLHLLLPLFLPPLCQPALTMREDQYRGRR
jgi:hypothetical protein